MSVVGQEEIRGDIWLSLDCGHTVRKEVYEADGLCSQCRAEAEVKPPRKSKARRRSSKKKTQYVPYTASNNESPGELSSDTEFVEAFWWRGKLRKQ